MQESLGAPRPTATATATASPPLPLRHGHVSCRRQAVGALQARLINPNLFLTARRHAEAAQQFRTAARLQPADPDALFNLGGSHELLAQPAEALHAAGSGMAEAARPSSAISSHAAGLNGKCMRSRAAGEVQLECHGRHVRHTHAHHTTPM